MAVNRIENSANLLNPDDGLSLNPPPCSNSTDLLNPDDGLPLNPPLSSNSTDLLNPDDGFLPKSARSEVPSEVRAAIRVQKVFRGYRARRQLADHAVTKKSWWEVIEGAFLRQNSQTFYAYENENTAARRWSRLKKKAAKVGKGLSKDEKARKLAIQHWLEAIDPRHRYGHNLKYYYDVWRESATKQPFFYWLDIGDGKDVNIPECKRTKLFKEQIEYLGPNEREQYEVIVDNGKLCYKEKKEPVDTQDEDKWIFVMSTSGKLYVAKKVKGRFQHSSFLAGGATKAAGRLIVREGILELMEAHSGHYLPTEENFSSLIKVLEELGTDLSKVLVQTVSDDLLKKPLGGRGPYDEGGDLHNTLDLHNTKEAPFGDNIEDEEESSTCTVHLVKSQHSGLIYRPEGPYDEGGDLHNTLDPHNTEEAPFGDNIIDEEESSRCTVHLIKSQHPGLIYRPEGDPIEDSTKMIKLETT